MNRIKAKLKRQRVKGKDAVLLVSVLIFPFYLFPFFILSILSIPVKFLLLSL
jgi:hypothetical protein